MLLLAIDTATPAVTAGVVSLDGSGVRTLAQRVTVSPRAHGELTMPHALDALAAARVGTDDIEAIVCGHGPGPYTGLRAGMATAAALGHGLGVPVYPVGSLDAIAAEVDTDEPFLVATDARRREVYWARYPAPTGAALLSQSALDGPHVQRPEELGQEVTGAEGIGARCRVGAGAAAELCAERLGLRVVEPAYPSPRGLALVAASEVLGGHDPAPFTPLYLRKPHAAEPGPRKRVSG